MIAWDGSAEAASAVRESLPLLAMSTETIAVQCARGLDRTAADPSFQFRTCYSPETAPVDAGHPGPPRAQRRWVGRQAIGPDHRILRGLSSAETNER